MARNTKSVSLPPSGQRPLRGVIYGRVSTDEQTENFSLETQVINGQRMALAFGITLVQSPLLDEYTGMSLERPKLLFLRELIRTRKIDALILNTSDRLSRKPAHGEILLDEMAAHGIRLFIVYHNREFDISEDTPDRDILLQEMIFNRRWRAMLLEALNRGRRGKVARGEYIGKGLPRYGYVKEIDPTNRRLKMIKIHPEEAAIVRSIYHWYYFEQIGVAQIMRRLKGVPTPIESKLERGLIDQDRAQNIATKGVMHNGAKLSNRRQPNEWGHTTIYRILRDEAYAGRLTMYEDPNNPVTINIPAIIDPEIWEKVQVQLNHGQKQSKRNTKKEYLMQHRLRCGVCHYKMGSHTSITTTKEQRYEYNYYICQSGEHRVSRPRCGLPKFRVELVDATVWGFVSDLIRHPKTLISKLEQAKKELDTHNHLLRERLEQIEATKRRQEHKLALVLEQYATLKTNALKQFFTRLQDDTEQLFDELTEEAARLKRELMANTISDSYIHEWRQYTRQVRNKLDQADFKKKQEIIEGLNITGVLTIEAEEDGRSVKVLYLSMYSYTERIPLEPDLPIASSSS